MDSSVSLYFKGSYLNRVIFLSAQGALTEWSDLLLNRQTFSLGPLLESWCIFCTHEPPANSFHLFFEFVDVAKIVTIISAKLSWFFWGGGRGGIKIYSTVDPSEHLLIGPFALNSPLVLKQPECARMSLKAVLIRFTESSKRLAEFEWILTEAESLIALLMGLNTWAICSQVTRILHIREFWVRQIFERFLMWDEL